MSDMNNKLRHVAGGAPTTVEYTSTNRQVIQYLVQTAASLSIPYKVISLGAGVTKFTTDTTMCPKCHGTGKC